MTNPITEFLENRKQLKLKALKDDEYEKRLELEQSFETNTWITHAASRAWQLDLVSHPGKFSHPDARITPVLFDGKHQADGYLRSGNAHAQHDVLGNAAALDVYAFLTLELNGRSVLTHFEDATGELKQLLNVDDDTFQQWRSGLLQIKGKADEVKTHTNVKQVYFPVKDNYHLLSILYPSGLMTAQRERIRQMKFSDATKVAREARRKSEFHEQGFADLPGLLTQNFGGTKPQNISKLNSNNRGQAWLMPCLPPALAPSYLRLPKTDFFQWLYTRDTELESILKALHKLLQADYNNAEIRRNRQYRTSQLFEWVLLRAALLQQQSAGWSKAQGFQLPLAQQLWLDVAYFDERQQYDDWQQDIAGQLSEWMLVTYRRFQKRQHQTAVQLGATEAGAFQKELPEYIRQHEEFIL
ncbi:MAG: type I-F CRISPR-associated protein Csy1 [Thiothrix sp.]|nr:type I-F CRISPR-associated protein Csy1 [Thiothrix sp.]HPQ95665.1 type I-F CRISPR-associated protein Csy1 [Thiolinea sp.]